MIIRELLDGPKRFTEVGPVTAKVLTERLRLLADYDIVRRDEQPGVPPRVEYAFTARGASLRPVLAALWRWGVRDEASWAAAR